MNDSEEKNTYFQKILQRTGGWYIFIAIIFVQFFSSSVEFVGNYVIQLNAEFAYEQLTAIINFVIITEFFVTNTIVIVGVYFISKEARAELSLWKNKEKPSRSRINVNAWQQITSLSWRYSGLLFIVALFTTLIPVLVYESYTLKVTTDQLIYTFFGSLAVITGISVLSLFLLGYLLSPTYEILKPQDLKGPFISSKGLSLSRKLHIIVFSIITTTVLLLAPIGYHQTIRALETGASPTLQTIRIESVTVTILIFFFGALLTKLFTTSIGMTLQELVNNFEQIERGNTKQKAKVISSDESGELAIYFNRMVLKLDELQNSLETKINIRTEQLKATSEVGRAVSSILDPDELVKEVVNLITEHLNYYAAIFIISRDGYWAELKSATGEAGQKLLKKKHRLSISGKNIIGSAINMREACISHDIGTGRIRSDNLLLPEARSEIALPLIVGGHVLGVLNAQSVEENVFDEEVTETLQGMVNQVAVALENARLFQETQNALRETHVNHQTQLSKAWTETLDTHGNLEFSMGEKPLSNEAVLNIPLALRDQVIGEITLESDADWLNEDPEWVESVATQTALALENARLLDESQRVALQERLIAEITGKIWASNTADGILRIAIKELGSALGATEAIIELTLEKNNESPPSQKSKRYDE